MSYVNAPFIGRKAELKELKQLQQKKVASLVILQGRRRIGKSRLVQEFAKAQLCYRFTGIAPSKDIDAQMQRDEFCRQLGEQLGCHDIVDKNLSENWGDVFTLLAKYVAHGKVILLFDEISWMGAQDATFLGKLKNAWDLQFSNNPQLMLILCGSVSSWIEKNIVSSTAFLGRAALYMQLDELPLDACNEFWGESREQITAYEKLKLLSVTGGVPRYLELIDAKLSAEENIRRLCFLKSSPLLNEFEWIFSDIFGARSDIYRKIIMYLVTGAASQAELLQYCNRTKTGDFSEYLHDLVISGFVARDYTWHLHSGDLAKLSHYRLKDNYLRFYLKYIYPNKPKIIKGIFQQRSPSVLPAWDTILALQFENLVLNNQNKIIKLLDIHMEEVIFANPFFQRHTKVNLGCQIDFMIQTRFNNVYICEMKFSRAIIGFSVINDVKQKIARIKLPKNFSYRPVLIHVNGVHEDVIHHGFFANIIDFGELLQ